MLHSGLFVHAELLRNHGGHRLQMSYCKINIDVVNDWSEKAPLMLVLIGSAFGSQKPLPASCSLTAIMCFVCFVLCLKQEAQEYWDGF